MTVSKTVLYCEYFCAPLCVRKLYFHTVVLTVMLRRAERVLLRFRQHRSQ